MTLSKAWYMRCNNCGDPGQVSTESPADARQVAKHSDGFVRRKVDGKVVDLCMVCRDKTTIDGVRPEWTKNLAIEAVRRGIRGNL